MSDEWGFLISLAGFRPLSMDHDGIPTKLRPLEPPIESYCHATTPIWQRYTLPVIHDGHDSSRRRPTPLLRRPGPWQSTPPPHRTFATATAGGTLRVPSPPARPPWQMHHHVCLLFFCSNSTRVTDAACPPYAICCPASTQTLIPLLTLCASAASQGVSVSTLVRESRVSVTPLANALQISGRGPHLRL